jgi:hypothetical protein
MRQRAAALWTWLAPRVAARWTALADAVDDIFLFPTSQNAIICEAINARRPISFSYRGGSRTVEPFCLGRVHRGPRRNESLLCYQTGGFAELVEVEGWKLYRAREIEEITLAPGTFAGDRPGYDPNEIPMYRVYCRVVPERLWQGTAPRRMEDLLHRAEDAAEKQTRVPTSHNDLMHTFRDRHPEAVPDLDDVGELAEPLPEKAEPASQPPVPRHDAGRQAP